MGGPNRISRLSLLNAIAVAQYAPQLFTMPFGSLYPIAPRAPFHGTSSGTTPPGDAGRIQLDKLPSEIVLRIVAYLPSHDALSFSETSRHVHGALSEDVVTPIRLKGRVQWTASVSALERLLHDVFAIPASRRPPLVEPLIAQARRFPPLLRERAYGALQRRHEGAAESVLLELTWRRTAEDESKPLPPLHHILSFPPHQRARLLPVWLAQAPGAIAGQATAEAWMAHVAELPPGDRLPTLRALAAAHADPGRPAAWRDLRLALLHAARDMAAVRGTDSPEYATLLNDLAQACSACALYEDGLDARMAVWDGVFELAHDLPAAAKRTVLASLAHMAEDESFQEQHEARWRQLIGAARDELAGDATADVLCGLVDMDPGWGERTNPKRALIEAVLQAAGDLEEEPCARVLASVLEASYYMHEDDETLAAIWEHLFEATKDVGVPASSKLIRGFGEALKSFSTSEAHLRWRALLDRAAGMEVPWITDALCALALSGKESYIDEAYASVLNAGARLPDTDRARLIATILEDRGRISPVVWRQILGDVARMSTGACVKAIPVLAHRLLFFPESPATAIGEPSAPRVPSRADIPFAEPPTGPDDALDKLSQISKRLPLGEWADLLLDLAREARESGTSSAVPWLLSEALRLPNNGMHRSAILTELAELAIRWHRPEDQKLILPHFRALWNAVVALPLESRASALHWLAVLIRGAVPGSDTAARHAQELAKLPPHDRDVVANERKRKEPPEGWPH